MPAQDPARIRPFADAGAFEAWLATNGESEPEIWIRIFKKGSGTQTITTAEAVDVALCWGWIDGIRKSADEASFLQRFTPRRPNSVWSQVNRDNVERLRAAGRMQPAGLRPVDAAKADGRWERAYRIRGATIPDDLASAIAANREATATFATLSASERFALVFRLERTRTVAGRRGAIARIVATLATGRTANPPDARSGLDQPP